MGSRPTAGEAVEALLTRIEELNPTFRAYTTVDAPGARAQAKEVDAARRDGRWLGVLDGMTVAVKDNIDTAGIRTASGSLLFADRVPNADAPVVERLRRAGGIILGKASMMELAFGVRGLDQVPGDSDYSVVEEFTFLPYQYFVVLGR